MSRFDVLVVGDLNPDVVLIGLENAEPRLGTEQVFAGMERTLGGSGAIASVNMSRLGLRTVLVARVGNDEPAAFCRSILDREGVEALLLVNPALQTGVTVAVAYPTDRLLLTSPGAVADLTAAEVPIELLDDVRHIHVSSYFLQVRLRAGLEQLFRTARARGVTTSLDPGWDPMGRWLDTGLARVLAVTDALLVNATELAHLTDLDEIDAGAAKLLALGTSAVVLKDGSRGAHYFAAGEHHTDRGFIVTPLDTTGAGDAFDAGYVAAMLEGRSVADRLRFANACGAVVTQVRGGAGGNLTRHDFNCMYERDR
jgi:sugar/nucleoside kinase (ribokinase family)